jgi:F0F1-type ATP synthase assembly protein I
MEQMLQRIYKLVFIIIPILALASGAIWWGDWRIPFSVLVGGALSLGSLRIIVWAVQRFLGTSMAQPIIIGISTLKIVAMFAIMVVLAVFGLLNVVAMITGFTVVLFLTSLEGYRAAKAGTL